jgi:carbon-monoxide dehydrogenase large subunit
VSSRNAYVGSPIERLEDHRLLRGEGKFVGDIAAPGMLHAAILRSPVAHARIAAIDVAAALASPGVRAVLTERDIDGPVPVIDTRVLAVPEIAPYAQPVIARGTVRYVGEPIAVVVAGSAAEAEDALGLIDIAFDFLPPVIDARTAADAPPLFDGVGNRAIVYTATLGEAPSDDGLYRRRESFAIHRHTGVPMEPRGFLAEWDGAVRRLRVSGAAKIPFTNRRTLARMLGMDEQAIDLIEMDVGGGFGIRGEFYPEDYLIPFAARRLETAVRWIEDRREHLLTVNHSRDMRATIEIACRGDGTIVSLLATILVDSGAYMRGSAPVGPRNVSQFLSGPYRIPHVDVRTEVVVTNKTPMGVYRGPGRIEADFFRERLLDLAAHDLGLDPVDFRRRNLVTPAEMPYRVATLSSPTKNDEYDSGDYAESLARCLADFGWAAKAKLQGRIVDGRRHGIAVGCFIEGGGIGPKETARLILEADGMISLHVGSAAIGQGVETFCAQIAADALGMPIDRLRVLHGSTTLLDEGFGAFHSRSVVMGGSAILDTAPKFLDEIRSRAARRFGCGPADVVLADGMASAGGSSVPWQAVRESGLVADGAFLNHRHTYSYGAHAAHVAVDTRTGHVEVVDYVAVQDVGRVINPLTMRGQMIGAIVQGLGGVFLEHLQYDAEGQLLTGTLADYLLPTALDFPRIRAAATGSWPSPVNPLGAKGAGEGGIIPVAGVISNAVSAALRPLGVEVRTLPLSPSLLWELIADAAPVEAGEKPELPATPAVKAPRCARGDSLHLPRMRSS